MGDIPVQMLARARAEGIARQISEHHQSCRACRRNLARFAAGGRRVRACRAERRLFAALERASKAGWPP